MGKTVLEDVGYNTWDTGASISSELLGLDKASKVLGNPAIMTPLNKVISGGRLARSVFNGQAAEDSKDLAKRLDAISRNVYGVRR